MPRSDASNIHKTRASNFSFLLLFFFFARVSGTWARNKNCNKRGEPCFRAFQRMKNGWMIRELGDIISSMVYGPFPPPSPAQVCATAFWNNDHRRAVFAHIRRVLEGVKPPLRRKKSLDIYISVYIRICENFIECGRVQVRFDGGEILKLIPRSYVFHFYKLWGESLFSLVFCCRKRFFFFYERYLMMFDLKITIDESGL